MLPQLADRLFNGDDSRRRAIAVGEFQRQTVEIDTIRGNFAGIAEIFKHRNALQEQFHVGGVFFKCRLAGSGDVIPDTMVLGEIESDRLDAAPVEPAAGVGSHEWRLRPEFLVIQ